MPEHTIPALNETNAFDAACSRLDDALSDLEIASKSLNSGDPGETKVLLETVRRGKTTITELRRDIALQALGILGDSYRRSQKL